MKQGRNSQLMPVIIIVVVIVFSVAAIVALVRTFILGGSDDGTRTTQQQQIERDEAALLNTAAERGVRMSVRGKITGDESFRSYQIVVTPVSRSMTTYEGYLDTPLDTVEHRNNTRAYEQFVYALNRAGMVQGQQLEGDANDSRGACYGGYILTFETLQNDQTVKSLWTTTCDDVPGSFLADDEYISGMFLDQIPESEDLIDQIDGE